MLSELSQRERETLILLAKHGANGAYDIHALNRLFNLKLLTIGKGRQVVMTPQGRKACDQAMKETHHD